ncbi:hypothetical protein SRB5_63520 [Streptomyces sp. RB5]|uniref:Uncharacterized protein n=1 Tax=Streptomyces smaragdinus TaxID=2585196 RepID=A0A7K0CRS3_9ACTN|nr:hypothetical protein [Streptomyces smaragdinus]MQY16159.1 hypothetical protein [Streptomyces smaragdinus]
MSNPFGPPPEGGYGYPAGGFGPPQGPPPPGQPPGPPYGTPPYGPSFPPGPPQPSGNHNGVVAAIMVTLAVILGVVLIVVLPGGDSDDDTAGGSDSSPSASDTYDSGVSTDGGGSSDGGSSSSSGGGTDDEPTTEPTVATDPVEDAFKAVSVGSCLPVWDTGKGGRSEYRWSHQQPPAAVSCSSEDALVQVSGTSGCSNDDNYGVWTYQSAVTGQTTQLCLTRIYHVGGCFLAIQENNRIVDMGALTAVDCTAKKVPVPYNQVMHITGVYNTSKGTDPSLCRRVAGDQTQYWSWTMDSGKTLLCTMVYRG